MLRKVSIKHFIDCSFFYISLQNHVCYQSVLNSLSALYVMVEMILLK